MKVKKAKQSSKSGSQNKLNKRNEGSHKATLIFCNQNLFRKRTNPNPSPIGIRFGFILYGTDVHNTSCSSAIHILNLVPNHIPSDAEEYIMSNIIEDFYCGNIEPQECHTKLKTELKKKLTTLAQTEDLLTSKLTEEEKDLFLKYTSQSSEFLCVSNADNFIAGFRFGVKFKYDTFVAD